MAMIYKHSQDNKARYCLGEEGNNKLIVIGVNPSTATNKIPDQTMTKIKKFSLIKGFSGWLVLNLYPQRTPKPNNLDFEINQEYHQNNLKVVVNMVSKQKNPIIWSAWGTTIEKRKYLTKCLKDIYAKLKEFDPKWIHVGKLTKKGHPRHPSRLAYDLPIINFDIKKYLELISK